MDVDVRQQRRNDSTLGSAEFGATEPPFLHDSRFQPLVECTSQHAIAYSLVHKASEMAVIQGIEEALNIQINHPAAMHRHPLLPDRVESVVS